MHAPGTRCEVAEETSGTWQRGLRASGDEWHSHLTWPWDGVLSLLGPARGQRQERARSSRKGADPEGLGPSLLSDTLRP